MQIVFIEIVGMLKKHGKNQNSAYTLYYKRIYVANLKQFMYTVDLVNLRTVIYDTIKRYVEIAENHRYMDTGHHR